jgi:hypothetical protein
MSKYTSKRKHGKRSRGKRSNRKTRRNGSKIREGGVGEIQPLTMDDFKNSFTAVRCPARFDVFTLRFDSTIGTVGGMSFDFSVVNQNSGIFATKATMYGLKKYEILLKLLKTLYLGGNETTTLLNNILTNNEYPDITRANLAQIRFDVKEPDNVERIRNYFINSKGGFRKETQSN